MGKQPKPYESPLSQGLAEEILSLFQVSEGEEQAPRTIKDLVKMIDQTNERLHNSMVAKLVANSLMQSLKKRGDASLVIRYDGNVVVRVVYGEEAEVEDTTPRTRRDTPMVQTTHKSDLPYLDALRAEAADLGLDISHLGRQRRAIHEYIETHKQNVKPQVDEVTIIPVEKGAAPPRPKRSKGSNGIREPETASEPDLSDILDLHLGSR
jgi:uncharacterized protein YnzC (UPF0291/DUF896 family)